MSRIGILPIKIPSGVVVSVDSSNCVTVKGPLGELSRKVDPGICINTKESEIVLERKSEQKQDNMNHGLYRSLLANMVTGVSTGYNKELELVGVGFRASNQGQLLELTVGYSHNIVFEIPSEIKIKTITERGKSPRIALQSHDKQLLGHIAAKIRSIRKPEPYKGKGIKYTDEVLRRKAGKSVAKT